jgi:hypothetical protein
VATSGSWAQASVGQTQAACLTAKVLRSVDCHDQLGARKPGAANKNFLDLVRPQRQFVLGSPVDVRRNNDLFFFQSLNIQ